jgi:microcystin-dependent protein
MQTFGGFPRRELSALRLLPPGGASGQILKKTSVTDYDAKWENESGGAAVIQPGEVVLGPWTSAPLGLVTLNGALLSRTTYANLWSFAQTYGKLVSDATWSAGAFGAFSTGDGSTTFRIPAINGYFIRGVYDETSYTIGTYVADSFAAHNHGVNDPSHSHAYNNPVVSASAGGGGLNYLTVPSGANTGNSFTGISIQNAGSGSETKPRNIALRACMRY